MPNATIYLTDDEYLVWMKLGEEKENKLKKQFKENLMKGVK